MYLFLRTKRQKKLQNKFYSYEFVDLPYRYDWVGFFVLDSEAKKYLFLDLYRFYPCVSI